MITRAIERAFEIKVKRGWTEVYFFFDVHDTILKSNYSSTELPIEFFPHAKEVLQMISKMEDVVMILYTCSKKKDIEKYLTYFESNDINFRFVNENPLVSANDISDFDAKPYFNVLFEDKAGFNAFGEDNDWLLVKNFLIDYTNKKDKGI